MYHVFRGGFWGAPDLGAPLFLLVKYLPLCQYLLKNQFMYRSKVCAANKIK